MVRFLRVIRIRLCFFGATLFLLSHSSIQAEVISPERAIQIAEVHGQPIFVMVGREGCPNCTVTKKNLSDQRFQRLLAKYSLVYVNADGPPPDGITALKKSPGNMLPFLYVVRADGKALFASSGVVDNKRLAIELQSGVAKAGNRLSLKKSEAIAAVVEEIQDDLSGDDLSISMQAVARLKRFGPLGKIPSYAKPALDANALVEGLRKKCTIFLDAFQEKFAEASPGFRDFIDLAQMVRISKSMPEIQKRSRRMWTGIAKASEIEDLPKQAKKLEREVSIAMRKNTNSEVLAALNAIAEKQEDAAAKQYIADEIETISEEKQ